MEAEAGAERIRSEQEQARLQAEKEEAEAQMMRLEHEEAEARLQAEKEEAEAGAERIRSEQEREREQEEARLQAEKEEVKAEAVRIRLEREEEEARLQAEKEEAEAEIERVRLEQEESEETTRIQAEKEEVEAEAERIRVEREEADLLQVKEDSESLRSKAEEAKSGTVGNEEEQRILFPNGVPTSSSRIFYQDFSSYPVEVESDSTVGGSENDVTDRELGDTAVASENGDGRDEDISGDVVKDNENGSSTGGQEKMDAKFLSETTTQKITVKSDNIPISQNSSDGVGTSAVTSFSAGFSSYMGNIPNMPVSLDFTSFIGQSPASELDKSENIDPEIRNPNALKPTDSNAIRQQSVNVGFEPPIDIDQVNGMGRVSLSAAEELAMNTSMDHSANRFDSEQDLQSDVGELYEESDIDDMYGSDSESHSGVDQNKNLPEAEKVIQESNAAVPQYAIEKFMAQLERIHSDHEMELQEMEKRHKTHIDEMKEKLDNATQSSKVPVVNEVASYDKFLAQQRQLEKEFNVQLKQREDMIAEVSERNMDLKKRVEELTIEAEGLNHIINARYVYELQCLYLHTLSLRCEQTLH